MKGSVNRAFSASILQVIPSLSATSQAFFVRSASRNSIPDDYIVGFNGGEPLKTLRDLKWLLSAGNPTPSCKAATLLYLHGVRVSASTKLKVGDVDLTSSPAKIVFSRPRTAYLTDELSSVLGGLAAEKSDDDLLLGYESVPEFHADFRRMVRTSKLVRFDLSDIKEVFKAAAGSDYALLKQYDSAQPFTAEDVERTWLKVLPKLIVGA
jgi:hypothetical protein